ncbi:MAG: ABC transporter permease subunit [candidate division KSB1 bacterium]|nr:ABC transporter permease subunit [candidate division KSB1 bacterium]MDZ7407437.1 ABC transporter permease subunit [candidate division KSB1 bacterium]
MLRELIFRDLLDYVKSLRFMLSFLIVVGAFILSGILFVGKYKLAVVDYRENETRNLKALEESSKGLDQVAMYGQRLINPPPVFGFTCTGFDDHLPNALYVNAFSVGTMDNLSRSNFLFPKFNELDWVFIIGILLSFVALALTFDGISREKEDGTLRLVMTNAFPRYQFILAKYVGALLVLTIPATIGILLNLIIVILSGVVMLTAEHWIQIGFIYILSTVYLSAYVLFGLLISILIHRSAPSLALCLVLWVVTVLFIPNTGGLLSQAFHPLPPKKEFEEKIDLARSQVWDHYPKEAQSFIGIDRYRPAHRWRAAAQSEQLEVEVKLREAYFNEQIQQVEWGQRWTRISPAAVYQYAAESLADVGISRFFNFRRQVKNYGEQLMDFVRKKDALDPESPHWINPFNGILFSTNPVKYTEIPKFNYKPRKIEELLRESLMDIFLLMMVNFFLFTISVASFLRFDVR